MMVCPLTHDKLREEGDKLINVKWGVKYPIRNGIPVMLIEEAQLPDGMTIDEIKAKIATEKQSQN